MVDDDGLMEELRALFAAAEPVDPRLLDSGRMAFAWRSIDAELAELSYDSFVDSEMLAGVRDDGASVGAPRLLGFGAVQGDDEFLIEVEVLARRGGPALTGQLVPPVPATVQVQSSTGRCFRVPADDLGRFHVDVLPRGPVRLRVEGPGRAVQTTWLCYARSGRSAGARSA